MNDFPVLGKWPRSLARSRLSTLEVSVQSSTAISSIDVVTERKGKEKEKKKHWLNEGNCSVQECVTNSINLLNSFACHCVFAVYAELSWMFSIWISTQLTFKQLQLATHLQPKEHSTIAYRVLFHLMKQLQLIYCVPCSFLLFLCRLFCKFLHALQFERLRNRIAEIKRFR